MSYDSAVQAARNVLDECVAIAFLSPSVRPRSLIRPMIQIGPNGEYSFDPSLSSVAIPTSDVMQLHMWPALAHEVFHAKLGQVDLHLQLRNEGGSRGKIVLALKALVNHFDEDEIVRLTQETTETPAETLQRKTGACYSRLHNNFFDSRAYPTKTFYRFQMNEVLCDLASLRMCGPADLLRSLVEWADYSRNIVYDFRNHVLNPTHPLHIIRLAYMIRYYENFLGYSERNDPILRGYASQYGDVIDFCKTQGASLPPDARSLFRAYANELLNDDTLRKFDNLILRLINKARSIDYSRWTALRDYGIERKFPREIGPLDILNIVWIIRSEAYSQIALTDFSLRRYNSILRSKNSVIRRLFLRLAGSRRS